MKAWLTDGLLPTGFSFRCMYTPPTSTQRASSSSSSSSSPSLALSSCLLRTRDLRVREPSAGFLFVWSALSFSSSLGACFLPQETRISYFVCTAEIVFLWSVSSLCAPQDRKKVSSTRFLEKLASARRRTPFFSFCFLLFFLLVSVEFPQDVPKTSSLRQCTGPRAKP